MSVPALWACLRWLQSEQMPRKFLQNYILEPWQRQEWPASSRRPEGDKARVAILTVNYNTVKYVSYLIFSLYRILGKNKFHKIVVVDNGSDDGSVPLLRALDSHGLVELIVNRQQKYHGPALNQGMSHLARQNQSARYNQRVNYVWILDSDVIILKSNVVRHAISYLRRTGAVMSGEFEYLTNPEGYATLCSLFLDPSLVWRVDIPPFHEDGAPALSMQRDIRALGLGVVNFPFSSRGYLLHLGSATLNQIAVQGITRNRYYDWAMQWRSFGLGYQWTPRGPQVFDRFLKLFRREIPALGPTSLASACEKNELLSMEL